VTPGHLIVDTEDGKDDSDRAEELKKAAMSLIPQKAIRCLGSIIMFSAFHTRWQLNEHTLNATDPACKATVGIGQMHRRHRWDSQANSGGRSSGKAKVDHAILALKV
jgi:hypothetical protein